MGGVCGARRLYSYNSFDARINEASVERFQMLKEIQNSKSSKLFPLWQRRMLRVHGTDNYFDTKSKAWMTGAPQIGSLYPYLGIVFFPLWRCGPTRAMAFSFLRFLPQSVGLHGKSNQLVAQTPNWKTQQSQERDTHASGRIRTHNLSRRPAADTRLRPRGHWDRPIRP